MERILTAEREKEIPALSPELDHDLLEQELKLSCTNVMLQCLDPESRCIFYSGNHVSGRQPDCRRHSGYDA